MFMTPSLFMPYHYLKSIYESAFLSKAVSRGLRYLDSSFTETMKQAISSYGYAN